MKDLVKELRDLTIGKAFREIREDSTDNDVDNSERFEEEANYRHQESLLEEDMEEEYWGEDDESL